MAADVGERVGILAGTPVLKIRMVVVPFFNQVRLPGFEFTELAVAVAAPRDQRAIVEALVVFDADKQSLFRVADLVPEAPRLPYTAST